MTTPILAQDPKSTGWEQTIYAFLAEKERRSGSMRTVRAYSGMLYRFFGTLGKPPEQAAWLHSDPAGPSKTRSYRHCRKSGHERERRSRSAPGSLLTLGLDGVETTRDQSTDPRTYGQHYWMTPWVGTELP